MVVLPNSQHKYRGKKWFFRKKINSYLLTRPIASYLLLRELSIQHVYIYMQGRVKTTCNSEEQILTNRCELRTNQSKKKILGVLYEERKAMNQLLKVKMFKFWMRSVYVRAKTPVNTTIVYYVKIYAFYY